MPTEVALTAHDGPRAASLLDDVLPVYREVFAEPPYLEGPDEVAGFVTFWEQGTASDECRVVIARHDNTPVGFAFGHLLPPDTDWWDGATSPLSGELTEEWPGRTFAVIELAVRKPARRQGTGRALHHQLLSGATAERAGLLVRPEPEVAPARAAYRSWGYQDIGQVRPGPDKPLYNAMLLPLR